MCFFPFTDLRNTSISNQQENDIGLDGVFLGITYGVFYGDVTVQDNVVHHVIFLLRTDISYIPPPPPPYTEREREREREYKL